MLTLPVSMSVFSQENEKDPVRDYVDSVRFTRQQLELIQNLRFSGYFQFQYQLADTAGINSFDGGNFAPDVDNRFAIRRGRLKMTYSDKVSQYVLQLDATEKGVAIRDAFIKIGHKRYKLFNLTMGVFDRPFGYEISYSSRLRESPERGRMSQLLFPNERDLGATFSVNHLQKEKKQSLVYEIGLFNGTGFTISDYDSKKDLISRINYTNDKGNRVKYGFGASVYMGELINTSKYVYSMKGKVFEVDSSASNFKSYEKRTYYGLNGQLNFFSTLGFTIIRAEYIFGKQPGTQVYSGSPITLPVPAPTYLRSFDGAYFYFIQNILKSKHQVVLKYDWYDPNVKVKGMDIGASGSNTGSTDIRFDTWGIGYIYRSTDHVRYMAYYDFVRNERTAVAGTNSTNDYRRDLKDNVLTLRVQYRF